MQSNRVHLADGRRLHVHVWMHEIFLARIWGTTHAPRLKTGWD
jgi:hypothetical protein